MKLIIGGIVLITAGCIGLVIWAAVHPNGGCPKGQHSVITTWIPIVINKSVIMEPLASCEAN